VQSQSSPQNAPKKRRTSLPDFVRQERRRNAGDTRILNISLREEGRTCASAALLFSNIESKAHHPEGRKERAAAFFVPDPSKKKKKRRWGTNNGKTAQFAVPGI